MQCGFIGPLHRVPVLTDRIVRQSLIVGNRVSFDFIGPVQWFRVATDRIVTVTVGEVLSAYNEWRIPYRT